MKGRVRRNNDGNTTQVGGPGMKPGSVHIDTVEIRYVLGKPAPAVLDGIHNQLSISGYRIESKQS